MGSKCNHKYLYKKKAEGNLKMQKRRKRKRNKEGGAMQSLARILWQPPEAGNS